MPVSALFSARLPVPPAYNPARVFVEHVPRLLEVFPQLRTSTNVYAAVFEPLGARIHKYPMRNLSLADLADESARLFVDSLILATGVIAVYKVSSRMPEHVRRLIAFSLSALILAWPFFVELGTTAMINYVRAALAFRTSLLAWDMFMIRTREEVARWSFFDTHSHLWLMPIEEEDIAFRAAKGIKYTPRLTSLVNVLQSSVLCVFSLLLGPAFPPPDQLSVQPWASYFINAYIMAHVLYFMLMSSGNLTMNLLGLVLGIEQLPMFENPFSTTSLREFWSRWNRAIASVLHRVIFGGKNTNVRQANKAEAASAAAQKKRSDDSPAKMRRRFVRMSLLAVFTFVVSGLLHEYLLIFSPRPTVFGWQTLFFLLNGLVTVASTYLGKFHPKLVQATPVVLRYLIMAGFYLSVSWLFFMPLQMNNMLSESQFVLQSLIFPRDEQPTHATFVYYPIREKQF